MDCAKIFSIKIWGYYILRAIDFFCGGGGMTNGLIQAGINVVAGVDLDPEAKETYEVNNHGASFVNADLNRLHTDYFEKKLGIERFDDDMIFVGCSPCQFYSIIRSSKEKSIKTKDLLLRFRRFVDYYRPGYLLIENVPGILTNKDSAWKEFLPFLEVAGYNNINVGNCQYDIVNMKDYGIGQNRKRFSLIATRLDRPVHLPEKENEELHVSDIIGNEELFPRIQAGTRDADKSRFHSTRSLSDINMRRIQRVHHDGGTRMDFKDDPELQLKCYEGKDNSFRDVYGRMFWNKPSPTITTKFLSISNGRFGHPEQDRGISIREGAALQSFPYEYCFETDSITTAARLIGNAVPPEYGRRLGQTILELKR